MDFEFDPAKSAANLKRHGIDFLGAQALWNDPDQRVNVDFPVDLLREIDQEARRLGVTRQAFIKVRLADSLVKNP